VDPEFGTGVVKITPAHDPNDFEVWRRHEKEIPGPKQVIDFDGKLNELAGPYAGLKVAEARVKVAADMQDKGLLTKVDPTYEHAVGICYRCGTVIEPLPMAQFFVKVTGLTQEVLKVLESGKTKVYGAGHDKILKHWLMNLKDWNISRQIVWGIRLPIWYQIGRMTKDKFQISNGDIVVGFLDKEGRYVTGGVGELLQAYEFELIEKNLQTLMAPPGAQYVVSREKPGDGYLQETDTFDTWFSSAQWPVVTLLAQESNSKRKTEAKKLKVPYSTEDFEYYYPTSVMETAYDILIFWVMRMLMMGVYMTGSSPFEVVYLHGLVRDEKGLKMSKSKGNVINPLSLVEKYGADALRMALVISTTPGQDSAVGESKVRGMRNFSNKIWNAARFIKMNHDASEISNDTSIGDEAFNKRLDLVIDQVSSELDRFKIGQAAEIVHNEFWHWFCDECIEQNKTGALSSKQVYKGLRVFLIMLHPFMPFVTEAAWEAVGFIEKHGLLITQAWPKTA
jgi:valyl-tRNA synthetase